MVRTDQRANDNSRDANKHLFWNIFRWQSAIEWSCQLQRNIIGVGKRYFVGSEDWSLELCCVDSDRPHSCECSTWLSDSSLSCRERAEWWAQRFWWVQELYGEPISGQTAAERVHEIEHGRNRVFERYIARFWCLAVVCNWNFSDLAKLVWSDELGVWLVCEAMAGRGWGIQCFWL